MQNEEGLCINRGEGFVPDDQKENIQKCLNNFKSVDYKRLDLSKINFSGIKTTDEVLKDIEPLELSENKLKIIDVKKDSDGIFLKVGD